MRAKVGLIAPWFVAAISLGAALATSSAESKPGYEIAENRYLDRFRHSTSDPKPMAHPQLAEAAASLFGPEAIALDFSTIEILGDGSKKTTAGTIWYSKGKVFLEHTIVPDGETPWEYATVGDRFLGWKRGESKVTSFKRYSGDTVDFLWYMADVSAIKASLHFMFLEKPEDFQVHESPPWRRLVLRTPIEGFSELVVRASPLWLREVVYRPPGESVEGRMVVEPPRAIDALPNRLESMVPKVEIEPTDWTIKSRMDYL